MFGHTIWYLVPSECSSNIFQMFSQKKLQKPSKCSLHVFLPVRQVLRRYSDATMARDLVRELESYGDPSNLVLSGALCAASLNRQRLIRLN